MIIGIFPLGIRWNLNKSKRDVVGSEGFHLVILGSLTYVHALMSWAYENSLNCNPSCGVEEDGLQHRAMVLACALAEAKDVGKMVVKKVKAGGGGEGNWDGSSGFWRFEEFRILKVCGMILL